MINETYQYPQDLVDYLTEQESEGSEIFTTSNVDGAFWIVKPEALEKWYVLINWHPGCDDWTMVNLCGKAVERVKKCFIEDGVINND